MKTLIIGGGVVGLSLAYGLTKRNEDVVVVCGSDEDYNASRGNFGLIWSQGKGLGCPEYSQWTQKSISLWPSFAEELAKLTGIDVELSLDGGMEYFTNKHEMEDFIESLHKVKKSNSDSQTYKYLNHEQLKLCVPEIGPKVVGATFMPGDGHVNPLQLLTALREGVRLGGAKIFNGARVKRVYRSGDLYNAQLDDNKELSASRVIIAAGLGSADLAPMMGFKGAVVPQQGQLLITEKLPQFLKYPSGTIRQVNDGGIQIGGSTLDRGLDNKECIKTVSELASHAVDVFPCLEEVNLLRSWACLRVMTEDGFPIYQESKTNPGAFFITCHSGITLAAIHSVLLTEWIVGSERSPDLSMFSEERFNV